MSDQRESSPIVVAARTAGNAQASAAPIRLVLRSSTAEGGSIVAQEPKEKN